MSSRPTTPHQFPWNIWNQLTGIDLRLLDELIFLSRATARRSPRHAHYCIPGRKYLARKLGCSIVTISRHIAKLKHLGIIEAFQRRPIAGTWQTNFFRVLTWQAWKFGQIRTLVTGIANRVSQLTHIAVSGETKIEPKDQKVAFGTLYDRWMSRGGVTPAS
jgi:DNA-binding transcriptional MocR family regulator